MKRKIRCVLLFMLLFVFACPFMAQKQAHAAAIVSTSSKKYSYGEMKKDIEALTEKYPGCVSYDIIGNTADGRNLYDMVLGNKDANKCMLVIAALHAREYMTSLTVMKQVEYYLQNYNNSINGQQVSETLNDICIHVVPMANPDGVTISQSGISKIRNVSLRNKLKKLTKGKGTARWKADARGVDLNRNWPISFRVKGKAGNDGYTGKTPASENEVKALIALKQTLKSKGLKGIVNYHTTGSIIYGYSYSSNTASVKSVTAKMYSCAKKLTGYKKVKASSLKASCGNSREYDLCVLQIPSITLEIGKKLAPNPISEFSSIWKKNKDVVIREAQLLR